MKPDIELHVPSGCDNAPRKQILIDFTLSLFTNNRNYLQEFSASDVLFTAIGRKISYSGVEEMADAFQEYSDHLQRLDIETVLTHGKYASINGRALLKDGQSLHFSDVYTFSNASKTGKIKNITSYQIEQAKN
ncbi:hypothetical protein [Alkalihalobacillus trypoxylicola]|uniref:SnoaL-like domain-containing protein n=1 Tax=Alkalihalobacillus trypoxylicola TaxID=519424 RepID=A0A162E792_9BACI|nr:hypothetical protein [Alkalihalobacillus trypoxylicola]KYG31945.1 hypothetical protein AZF04_03990 [Alkalihalobacillus trypoxylicola]